MGIARPLSNRPPFRWVSSLLAVALTLSSTPVLAHPLQQSQDNASTLWACTTVDEAAIQDELNSGAQQIFSETFAELNVGDIVLRHWVGLDMDAEMEKAVNAAIERVKNDTNLWERFVSGWSPDEARKLTELVVEYTFDSPGFRSALEKLSTVVAEEIGNSLVESSADSYSGILYCLQTFIGAKYSEYMADAFKKDLESAVGGSDLVDGDSLPTGISDRIAQHTTAIGGVGIIIVTQLTRKVLANVVRDFGRRIAGNVAARILGRVGTEVIPIVGSVVGIVLISFDVLNSLDGAVPEIQKAMVSTDVKSFIRGEITNALQEDLDTQMPVIARGIADELFEEWRIMREKMRQVIDLAAQDEVFSDFLKTVESEDGLERLVGIVDALTLSQRQPAIDAAINSGELAAVLALPEGAVQIVRDTGSIEVAAAWGKIAGSRLNDVAEMEIYESRTPETFEPEHLVPLSALDDKRLVGKVLLLENSQIDQLTVLPNTIFRDLAVAFNAEQLAWLAEQLPVLPSEERDSALMELLSEPTSIERAMQSGGLQALISNTATGIAQVSPSDSVNLLSYLVDGWTVFAGAMSMSQFAAKYGNTWTIIGVTLVGFTLLLLAILMIGITRRLYEWSFGVPEKKKRDQK